MEFWRAKLALCENVGTRNPGKMAAAIEAWRKREKASGLLAEYDRLRHAYIETNKGFVLWVAKRTLDKIDFHGPLVSLNDMVQDGQIGLINAVDRMDPTKSTTKFLLWGIYKGVASGLKKRYEQQLPEDWDAPEVAAKETPEVSLIGLKQRERNVLELRYGIRDGFARTFEQVGEMLGVTKQRVQQIEARVIKKLRVRA